MDTSTTENLSSICSLCRSSETIDFFQLRNMPTQDGVMSNSYRDALDVNRGDIFLRYCANCTYIGNEAHDQSKVAFDQYDFSLDHSSSFKDYIDSLCLRLQNEYSLTGKTVIDIGCGAGYFLKRICELTQCHGIGIDPGFDLSEMGSEESEITFLREYYGKQHQNLQSDIITCRLVLDLFTNPFSFVDLIRDNISSFPETIVYFEVPDAIYTFRDRVIWNVVYEHRSWFTKTSLRYLFEKSGFETLRVAPCWNDEYLGIDLRMSSTESASSSSSITGETTDHIISFANHFRDVVEEYGNKIEDLKNNNQRIAAWGAGARAVTFFNLFQCKDLVPLIVDINTRRQGKFLPGSGQKIISPKALVEYHPDILIITNPTYADEIKHQVAGLGLKPRFWVL